MRNHHELYIHGIVVLGDGLVEHQRRYGIALGEERAVLGEELLVVDRTLEIVPVKSEIAALVGIKILHELDEIRLGEISSLVHERRILGNERRKHVALCEIQHLGLPYLETCFTGLFNKEILVDEILPCGISDLDLLLAALDRRAGHKFIDSGELLHILLEVVVRHGLAVDFSNIVFG